MRVAQQNASIFITFYSIRQFELTTVSMVNNSSTFLIMLLGFVLLRERTSTSFFALLVISQAATGLVLFGQDSTDVSSAKESSSSNFFGILLLLLNPLIIATGVVAMRNMRKMHEAVITSYMNLMLLAIMLTVVYAQGSDLSPARNFTVVDWIALAGLATSNVGSQTFRFRAI